MNYSFVSIGENPTVRLWIFIFHFTLCWYLSMLCAMSDISPVTFLIRIARLQKYLLILYITQALSHHNLLGKWDCESVCWLSIQKVSENKYYGMDCSCVIFFWFSERGERRWDVRNDILCSDGASWILPPSLITPWPLSLQSLPGQQLLEEGEEGRYHKIISDNQHLIYKWKIKKFSPTPPI